MEMNEKSELHVPGMRYAFAFVFYDSKGRFLLVFRGDKLSADYPFLDKYDFPVASRGILPDGSFKVKGMLDNEIVKEISFLGIALEQNPVLGDEPLVVMPCYAGLVSVRTLNKIVKADQGILFTVRQLLDMEKDDPEKIISKVAVLLNYMKICQGWGEVE